MLDFNTSVFQSLALRLAQKMEFQPFTILIHIQPLACDKFGVSRAHNGQKPDPIFSIPVNANLNSSSGYVTVSLC